MANGDNTLTSILKIWGPITLVIGAITLGTASMVQGDYTEERVKIVEARLEKRVKEMRIKLEKLQDTQRVDIKEIRKALGALQLQSAKICVTVGAKCN